MTGIRNKGAFVNHIEQINEKLQQEDAEQKPAFAIVIFDCNDLKQINDHYGHDHGDDYLKTTSSLICRIFAHSPVFRLGGDEFGVILQNADYDNRDSLMKQFDRTVKEENLQKRNPWEKVNVSKGMAVYTPNVDEDASSVVTRADQKMYENKNQYHA